jgi:uncharacterized membrane protein
MSTTRETTRTTTRNGPAQGSALSRDARPRADLRRYQRMADSNRGTGGLKTADFLGFLGMGIGFAEVLAPRTVARFVGVKNPTGLHTTTIRALGAREIASGLAILTSNKPAGPMWSRVVGDGIDLALLAKVASNPKNDRGCALFAMAGVAAVTAVDVLCARQLSSQPRSDAGGAHDRGLIRVRRAITIGKPVKEVFAYWRDLANLPRFMRHLESVTVTGEKTSHWIARGPAGKTVEWDAEIIDERQDERISWRSLIESDVYSVGTVEFHAAPGGRGTEVRVELFYHPPFGKLGSKIAMLFREEPRQQIADDLRCLKQVLEVGEVVLSDASAGHGPHPARPREDRPAPRS